MRKQNYFSFWTWMRNFFCNFVVLFFFISFESTWIFEDNKKIVVVFLILSCFFCMLCLCLLLNFINWSIQNQSVKKWREVRISNLFLTFERPHNDSLGANDWVKMRFDWNSRKKNRNTIDIKKSIIYFN